MCAPAESIVEPLYPATRRFQAPHIVFTETGFSIDMAEVPLPPATGADADAPDPTRYEGLMAATDFEAPYIEVTPPSRSVTLMMERVADSPALLDPADIPDSSTHSKFFGSDGRPLFLAPFIEMVDNEGGVGLEMREVVADAPTASVDPAKFAEYMDIAGINMAPVITIGEGVVKVGMRDIDGDCALEDDAAGMKMHFREKGGMHSAPHITFPSAADGSMALNVEYKHVSGYDCGLNCAPVIEFDGEEGISLKMLPIVGDSEPVYASALEYRGSDAYSSSWKPTSVLSKQWV